MHPPYVHKTLSYCIAKPVSKHEQFSDLMAVAYYRDVVMINYSPLEVVSWAKVCAEIVVSYTVSKKNVGMIITERSVLCGCLYLLNLKV